MRPVVAAKLSLILFLIALPVSVLAVVEAANAQAITSGNETIDPTSKIHLKGQFPPASESRIKITFRQDSTVAFLSSGSKQYLYLDFEAVPNSNEIESKQRIDEANPVGEVPAQTVDITVETIEKGANASFVTTNKWPAKFDNKAVIVKGPATVGYNRSFNLSGWDFGQAGTLTVHFANNTFGSSSVDDKLDLKNVNPSWNGSPINYTIPGIGGLVEQPVGISFTTKGGRTSNTWPAKFEPRMVLQPAFWQSVNVTSCSYDAAGDLCNASTDSGLCFVPVLDPTGNVAGLFSVVGEHIGCWQAASNSGTDSYWLSVNNGWQIVSIEPSASVTSNGSVQYQPTNPLPRHGVALTVQWQIGTWGGYVDYAADIMVEGPYGVPY